MTAFAGLNAWLGEAGLLAGADGGCHLAWLLVDQVMPELHRKCAKGNHTVGDRSGAWVQHDVPDVAQAISVRSDNI